MKFIAHKSIALVTALFFVVSMPAPRTLDAAPQSTADDDFSGSNINASAGGEVRGQAGGEIGGVPISAGGSASASGKVQLNSGNRPSVGTQTDVNLTGSIGGHAATSGSGSHNTGPLAQGSASQTSQSGNASFAASGNVGTAGAGGGYSASADSSGAQVSAHGNVKATVVEGQVQGHYRVGTGSTNTTVSGSGKGTVGVEATGAGQASIGRQGIEAGGTVDAVAGARATGDAGGTINLLGLVKVGAKLKGEAIAGAGGSAHANLQASGKGIAVSAGVAGAVGLGGGTAVELEVDVSGITEPIGKAIDQAAGALGKAAGAVGGFFKGLFGGVKEKEEDGNMIGTEVRQKKSDDSSADSAAGFGTFDALRQGGLTALGQGGTTPATAGNTDSRNIGVAAGVIHTDSPSDRRHPDSFYASSPSSPDDSSG